MAFKLKKKDVGIFTASSGQTVEVGVSSASGNADITRLVYDDQHVSKGPWRFKTVKGNLTLFVFLESTVVGERVDLNEIDGANKQLLAFSFFSPTFPQDDIEIQA
jgi:hypothetical protein